MQSNENQVPKFAAWESSHFYRLLWLFVAAFGLHIVEESAGFSSWVKDTLKGDIDIKSFYINNAGFMLLLVALTALAARKKSNLTLWLLFFWVSGQQFWNFIFHMYTQFHFRAYSPGYFTALFLYFPIFLYLTYLALRERRLYFWQWGLAFCTGAFGMWFTIWAGLYHFAPFPWDQWF
ncbi:MAG: hypothetical protein OHK0011_23420 [Turneriella sp.]